MLDKDEEINSWQISVETTKGRIFTIGDLGINLPENVTTPIDEIIEEMYAVTWQD